MTDRDANGRFVPGNASKGGRPARKVEESYLETMRRVVTAGDWEEITVRAIRDAKRGDTAARKWLSDYLIGSPVQKQEVTGADGAALKIVVEYVDDADSTESDPAN